MYIESIGACKTRLGDSNVKSLKSLSSLKLKDDDSSVIESPDVFLIGFFVGDLPLSIDFLCNLSMLTGTRRFLKSENEKETNDGSKKLP